MTTSRQIPEVLSVEEAGQVLRISRQSAYQAVRAGEIPSVRIGRRVLVPRHALLALLDGTLNDEAPGDEPALREASTAGQGRRDGSYAAA
jgi:excisionase family DNA binding protein